MKKYFWEMYFFRKERWWSKLATKKIFLRNALNEIFCSQLQLVLAEAIFYQYVRTDWGNQIQYFTKRNICSFGHKYEAIFLSLLGSEYHNFRGYFFYTYTFIRVCWRNSEMSQILGAPILQSGVISAWQGKGRLIGELFSSQPQTPYWTLNPYILLT